MKTVLQSKDTATDLVLYMAMELSHKKWKLGLSNGEHIRVKTIAAGDWSALRAEVELTKTKLNCPGALVVAASACAALALWHWRANCRLRCGVIWNTARCRKGPCSRRNNTQR